MKFEIGDTVRIKIGIKEVAKEVWDRPNKPFEYVKEYMFSQAGKIVKIRDRQTNGKHTCYEIGDGFAWDERFLEKCN